MTDIIKGVTNNSNFFTQELSEASTEDQTSISDKQDLKEMSSSIAMQKDSGIGFSDFTKDVLCFGAGVVDGAAPLPFSPVDSISGGEVSKTCGWYYTAGNVTGTVGSMLVPGYGEVKAGLKGIGTAIKNTTRIVGKVKIIGKGVAKGAKVIGKHLLENQIKNGGLEKNITINGVKYINDKVIKGGLNGIGRNK